MDRFYRIRVWGKPREVIDAHHFVHAVLMLARELHAQQLREHTYGDGGNASLPPEAGPDHDGE